MKKFSRRSRRQHRLEAPKTQAPLPSRYLGLQSVPSKGIDTNIKILFSSALNHSFLSSVKTASQPRLRIPCRSTWFDPKGPQQRHPHGRRPGQSVYVYFWFWQGAYLSPALYDRIIRLWCIIITVCFGTRTLSRGFDDDMASVSGGGGRAQ